jgi:hypothetical protein
LLAASPTSAKPFAQLRADEGYTELGTPIKLWRKWNEEFRLTPRSAMMFVRQREMKPGDLNTSFKTLQRRAQD